jgi:hypothetical protein
MLLDFAAVFTTAVNNLSSRALLVIDTLADHRETDRMKKHTALRRKNYPNRLVIIFKLETALLFGRVIAQFLTTILLKSSKVKITFRLPIPDNID